MEKHIFSIGFAADAFIAEGISLKEYIQSYQQKYINKL